MDNTVIVALVGIIATVIGAFVWLLKYVVTENAKREARYQTMQDVSSRREENYQQVIKDQQSLLDKMADKYEDLKQIILQHLGIVQGAGD